MTLTVVSIFTKNKSFISCVYECTYTNIMSTNGLPVFTPECAGLFSKCRTFIQLVTCIDQQSISIECHTIATYTATIWQLGYSNVIPKLHALSKVPFCQILSNWWTFRKLITDIKGYIFIAHGVVLSISDAVRLGPQKWEHCCTSHASQSGLYVLRYFQQQ